MAIYRNRMKFSGDPGSGSNILVKYGDKQEYDEVVLNEALADLETKIKDGGVLYVETLPTGEDITNSVYGMEHIISSTDTKNSLTDVIGSYMHLDGSYYVPNTGATIVSTKYGAITTVEEIDNLHYKINNDTVVFKFDTSDTYTITISETHIDYYIGNKEEQTIKQIATLENVSDEYIHKSEKGTAGGIATLDSDGKLPVSQLPTGSEIYLGTYDASTGVYPESETLVSGCYYRISVAGTIDGVSYNVNDKLCWNGTVWQKIAQTESVTSVNGMKGDVVVHEFSANDGTGIGGYLGVDSSGQTSQIYNMSGYDGLSRIKTDLNEVEIRRQNANGSSNNSIIKLKVDSSGNGTVNWKTTLEKPTSVVIENQLDNTDRTSISSISLDTMEPNVTISAKDNNGTWGSIYLESNAGILANNKNVVTKVDGNEANANGEVTSRFGAYTNDLNTENKTDTWVPVLKNSTIQHRVIPTNLATTDGYVRGATSDISRAGTWITARDRAQITNEASNSIGGYSPTMSIKTTSGEWSVGNLGGEEFLTFSYTTDTNYKAGTNAASRMYLKNGDTGTIITSSNLSSNLPSGNVTGSLSGTTLTLYIK